MKDAQIKRRKEESVLAMEQSDLLQKCAATTDVPTKPMPKVDCVVDMEEWYEEDANVQLKDATTIP